MTPTSPPPTPSYLRKKFVDENIEKGIVGFGVPIQMIPTEAVELYRPSSPRKSPTLSNFGSSRFYSFQNDNDNVGDDDDNASVGSHTRSDREVEYNQSNMISFYSGGGSLRSSPNNKRYSYRQQQQHHHHHPATSQKMKGMPSLSSNAPSQHQFLSENPIMNLLLGRSADWDHSGRSAIKTVKKKRLAKEVISHALLLYCTADMLMNCHKNFCRHDPTY